MENQQWTNEMNHQPVEESLFQTNLQMDEQPQLEEPQPEMNPNQVPPMGNAGPWMGPPPMMNMMPPYSPDFAILRDKGRSPMFLTCAILLLVLTLGQIAYSMSSFVAVDDSLLTQVSGSLGSMIDVEYLQISFAGAIILNLIGMCPQILSAVGVFVLAIRIRKMELPSEKKMGLGAVKASIIIQLSVIIFCVVFLALILLLGIIAGSSNAEALSSEVIMVFVVVGVIFASVLVPFLIYQVQLLNICSRVQEVLRTGNLIRKRISMYVIVMNYILLALNLIAMFFGVYDWIGILLTLVGVGVSLMFTIVLQKTRTAMEIWRVRQYR